MTSGLPPTRKKNRPTSAERLEADIRMRVLDGRYPPGSLLPGRRALAEEYEVGPITVEQAVKRLIAEGLLRSENGRGTFVVDRLPGNELLPQAETIPSVATEPPLQSAHGKRLGIIAYIDGDECAANPELVNPAMSITSAVEAAFTSAGGTATFFNMWMAFGTGAGYSHSVEYMLTQYYDALVFIDIYDNKYGLAELRSLTDFDKLPLVYVSGVDNYVPCGHIYYDNRDAGYRAAELLCSAGWDRVVFLAPYDVRWVELRIEGAALACHSRKTPVPFEVVPSGDRGPYVYGASEIVDQAAETLLSRGIKGAAVVAANDTVALSLISKAASQGFAHGQDYGIVGFDDIALALMQGLTSARAPYADMGRCASEAAVQLIGGSRSDIVRSVRTETVLRASHRRTPLKEPD